jgi:uncharacterized membrane protein
MEQHLAQYGAIGVLLAVFVVLFVWMFKALFSRFLQHLDVLTTSLREIVKALEAIKLAVEDHHKEVMRRLPREGQTQ